MRLYLPAGLADLETLVAGNAIDASRVIPTSEDEEAEFEAFSQASDGAVVVVSADVDAPDSPVTLADVASFHVDLDGSGDLAWYATQEIDAVLFTLKGRA